MTTTPTSVDALRTRLARAFEVAALRDPSAELAAFEAAVRASERHEHGERIVKAIDEQGTWIGPMTKRELIRIIAHVTAARSLSPPP